MAANKLILAVEGSFPQNVLFLIEYACKFVED
jgi:hypothetical protein